MNITDAVFEIEKLNGRIAELKQAYDAILDDCRIQERRIKMLEDALELIADKPIGKYSEHDMREIARAALEVNRE